MGKRYPLRMLVESTLCRGEVGAPEAAVGLGARHLLCLVTKAPNGLGCDRPSLTLCASSQLRTSLLHTRQNEDIIFSSVFHVTVMQTMCCWEKLPETACVRFLPQTAER